MSSNPARSDYEPAVGPEKWVERYADGLFRYARSRVHSDADAEEIVQETFLSAIRHQQQFAGKGSQWKWLLSILNRKIVDAIRRRERQPPVTSALQSSDLTHLMFDANGRWRPESWPDHPAPPVIELQELSQIVQRCLAKIPHQQASAFVLSVMHEMDPQAICQELNITPANLAVRLHRARLGIAKCVRSKWLASNETSTGYE